MKTETQKKWRQKQIENGNCIQCGQPAAEKLNGGKSQQCLKHLIYQREYHRKRLNCKRRILTAKSYQNGDAFDI